MLREPVLGGRNNLAKAVLGHLPECTMFSYDLEKKCVTETYRGGIGRNDFPISLKNNYEFFA
jgi:hypothetical protein